MPLRFVDAGGVVVALESRGHGRHAVLFAHGWISARRMWYDVVERLDPARTTAYLLDFRGAGESDRPLEGHDLAGYTDDLRAALADVAARHDGVTIAAHSMGGKVAQYLATERPPALRKLVLVAPGSARAFAMNPRHRELAADAFGSRVRIERFQRSAMVRSVASDVMERLTTDALLAQREAWFGWYDRGRTVDFADRLDRIAVPTVVVAGENDPLAPPSRLKRDVVEPIAGALFVNLRRVGHNLPVEAPGEVAAIVERVATDQA